MNPQFTLPICNWQEALKSARPDEAAGIRIAPLTDNSDFNMYVTEIPPKQKVNAHYHQADSEIYSIIQGHGVLHIAHVLADHQISDIQRYRVSANDFFTVPPNTIHQLENTGEVSLILIFGCPPSHLLSDRVMHLDLTKEVYHDSSRSTRSQADHVI